MRTASWLLLLVLLVSGRLQAAAIDPTFVWHIRSDATAGNVNGGGFKPGATGTDFSTQAAAQYNLTGVTTAGADAILLSASAAANMVGNAAHIISGTNFIAGWYEIISVSVGVSITLNTTCTSAAGAAGVVNIGGALSMGSTLDDDFFDFPVAGNTIDIKSGTYTLGEAVAAAMVGTGQLPIKMRGFTTTPGDTCTGTNRPTWINGANSFSVTTNTDVYNLIVTGSGATGFGTGAGCKVKNCKSTNTSTTADRTGFTLFTDGMLVDSEAVSYRGFGVSVGSTTAVVLNCYIHDSSVGINAASTSNPQSFTNNIITSCYTAGFRSTSAATGSTVLYGNTIHGFNTPSSTTAGVLLTSGTTDIRLIDNIITGFATGVVHPDVQSVGYDNYNDYQNNTVDIAASVGGASDTTRWQKGPNDQVYAPSFTDVGLVSGATATTTATNHLVQSGATFIASGVTPGRDFLYISGGTGVTAGVYGIATVDSETQLTTDITLTANATADKVFKITTGRNFSPGSALKALGSPSTFQGGYSTSYTDPGAVQRQEGGGGQSSSAGVK